ncbi:Aldose 1-epimerase [Muriicola jejuensis]|uniref:Aldose 1-epimerase n=1 Tax=Muriicola jejuensis TaxID=504488 RepID=A0A6P0UBG6_9FLAO|nr:aldose 1-epimerase [Muriicola jejuensis]NER10575.1 aldose 1-epimerase [Muriicola jejuensis]SMP17900.1 Aldose 1-epimerase [Muriicola jejuensis]
MVTLEYKDQVAVIEGGELISYKDEGFEYMHQKGQPGWGNSDAEMFPVIGPTAAAGYRVQVPKGNAVLDQHGHLRELRYTQQEQKERSATYIKQYTAGTLISNSKYPARSKAPKLIWPFSFVFKKHFQLGEEGLKITFGISGDKDMPYMLGYHPAFQLRTENARVIAEGRSYGLREVMEAGDRALEVSGTELLILEDEKRIGLRTRGFGQFMLWSPVASMICVEPITFYPYAVEQTFLHEGFRHLDGPEATFEVLLIPNIKS